MLQTMLHGKLRNVFFVGVLPWGNAAFAAKKDAINKGTAGCPFKHALQDLNVSFLVQ